MSESVSKLTIKSYHALKKLSAPHKYKTALVQQQPVLDCEIFVKKIARPKHCKARPSIQRIQDLQSGCYFHLLAKFAKDDTAVSRGVEHLALVLQPVTGLLHLPPGGHVPHRGGVTVQT